MFGLPLSVKTPPRRGPATEAIPYTVESAMQLPNIQVWNDILAPINPVYIGRFTSGTLYATI